MAMVFVISTQNTKAKEDIQGKFEELTFLKEKNYNFTREKLTNILWLHKLPRERAIKTRGGKKKRIRAQLFLCLDKHMPLRDKK